MAADRTVEADVPPRDPGQERTSKHEHESVPKRRWSRRRTTAHKVPLGGVAALREVVQNIHRGDVPRGGLSSVHREISCPPTHQLLGAATARATNRIGVTADRRALATCRA
jgi:hypothetical protein